MPAFLWMAFVLIAGPGIMDGGFVKIKHEGVKKVASETWAARKPVVGNNYGNK